MVLLLVAVVSTSLAQQSSEDRRTGGRTADRRLALRRFRGRTRDSGDSAAEEDGQQEGRRQQPRRLANQDKIQERRRELLQRNGVAHRRKIPRTKLNEVSAAVVVQIFLHVSKYFPAGGG